MLSAAVASSDTATSGFLRACLQQTGLVNSVVDWTFSDRSEWCVRPGESIPDVVLMGLSAGSEPCFTLAAQLRRLRPTVWIIASSPQKQLDPQLLLQAMRSGVQEFLPAPVNTIALQKILTRFLQEREPDSPATAEKLILVMGSKGGVGTSTVILNLGVQLVRMTKKRVVLLDFARPFGHISLLLDLQPKFSLRDAVGNLDRMDSYFFSGLLTKHKTGLEILAGISQPDGWQRISAATLERVVNVAQSTYDFVLMDYGSVYSPEWSSTLCQARMILLVAEANVPSLWALERHMSMLLGLGCNPERIRVVINRWNRDDEETLESVQKNFKLPIFARLPNDFRQVSEAINRGTPFFKNHHNPLVTQIQKLAGQLAGISVPAPVQRNGLISLFSYRNTK